MAPNQEFQVRVCAALDYSQSLQSIFEIFKVGVEHPVKIFARAAWKLLIEQLTMRKSADSAGVDCQSQRIQITDYVESGLHKHQFQN